jgi:hypothetical protein
MRQLTRQEKIAIGALENAIEHEPALRPVLVHDYATARVREVENRAAFERRLVALTGHVDEPGSRSALAPRDGLAPYGSPDPTGFGEGCVV